MKGLRPFESNRFINDLRSFMDDWWQPTFELSADKSVVGQWLPAIDIHEEEDKFIITADVPGVDPKDIEISFENNVLTLKGKREEVKKEKKGTYTHVERMQGQFYRRFTLPTAIDSKNIKAKSQKGVLEVIIPKQEQAVTKKINIEVE